MKISSGMKINGENYMCKFEEEIRLAKEEIATWTEGKRSSVQLEGIDKYLQ